MSTIPSRTRSLRKPAGSNDRYGRAPTANPGDANAERRPAASERSAQSPSRLPVKPTPPSSTSTSARPPSSTGSLISNASMRPPPSRANTSKPTSSGLQRSASNRRANDAPSGTDPVKQDRSRPPLTQSKHLRNASTSAFSSSTRAVTHTRNKSSSTLLGGSTALRPPSHGAAVGQKALNESQLRRPVFSTLQQHFSPAKSLAPKPHPAAFLAPPSPSKLPSNIAISAETAKLQNELLQLHLLHKDAVSVKNEWRSSAKRKLGARFLSVVDRKNQLVHLEVAETGKINAAALKQWQGKGILGWGLEEKIQMLDEVVTGVWNLGESGGKYARVVRKFERWLSRSQDILEARAHNEGIEDDEVVFLEKLDAGWRDDCLNLGRKLETWRNHLKDLGSPESGSSLATVVKGCRRLVKGMLAELNVMAEIEKDVVMMEADWIKSMNDDVMDDDNNKPVAGAIWRTR